MTTTHTTRTKRAELPDMLTVAEAADALRVGIATVRGWIGQGYLAATRPGRGYLIPRTEVERLLAPTRRGGRA